MQTSQKLNYSHNKTRSHLLLKANLQSQQKPLPQQIQEMSQKRVLMVNIMKRKNIFLPYHQA